MDFRCTPRRFIAWTLASWFASVSVAGADPDPSAALYFESDLALVEDFLEGQRWVGSGLYRVQLRGDGAPLALRFRVTLASGESFELALEALDGEPLASGAFASSDSGFRINRLDWGDGGELLALDADFEVQGIGDDRVFGRIIWNTSWDPEEPPFIGLTEEEYELGYWGQATLTECVTPNGAAITENSCRGTTFDNVVRLTVDLDHLNAPEPGTPRTSDLTWSRAGDRAESQGHDSPAATAGTRVDSIRYSKEPAQSPSAARRTIEHEVAQLDQAPNPSQFYFAGWPEPARGKPNDWQDFDEIGDERDSEMVPETEPATEAETNSPVEPEWVASAEDLLPNSSELRAALERAVERSANDELAGAATALVEPIQRSASAANPAATPPPDRRIVLETLLWDWLVASSAAVTALLERASAFWLGVSW